MNAIQGSLFGHDPIAFDPDFRSIRRIPLSAEAWLDHAPGFLTGHERLLAHIGHNTAWQQEQRAMFDRVVAVPRLVAGASESGGHPILDRLREALSVFYDVALTQTSFALYRDGTDSVAWHGDTIARALPQTLVVTLSLGAPRPFRLRPVARGPGVEGGKPVTLNLGWGDLVVMGGSCQRTWEHCVPKRSHADPRLVVMFRPTWRAAEPPVLREVA